VAVKDRRSCVGKGEGKDASANAFSRSTFPPVRRGRRASTIGPGLLPDFSKTTSGHGPADLAFASTINTDTPQVRPPRGGGLRSSFSRSLLEADGARRLTPIVG